MRSATGVRNPATQAAAPEGATALASKGRGQIIRLDHGPRSASGPTQRSIREDAPGPLSTQAPSPLPSGFTRTIPSVVASAGGTELPRSLEPVHSNQPEGPSGRPSNAE